MLMSGVEFVQMHEEGHGERFMSNHLLSEAQITKAATRYMGKPAFATVGLAFGAIGLYAFMFLFATGGTAQLLLAFVLSSYLVYVIYTPLHEAVHRNISGKSRGGLLWLNHAVGYSRGLYECNVARCVVHHAQSSAHDASPGNKC